MSSKSRGGRGHNPSRRPPPPRTSRPVDQSPGLASATSKVVDALLKAARQAVGGPFEVLEFELLASGFGSTIVTGIDDPGDLPSATRTLLGEVARRPRPEALAMLRAFAAVMPEPVGPIAAEIADRMRDSGVADPPWANLVGRPTFTGAWHGIDELEDQAILAIGFDYAGIGRHVVHLMFDANFQGLIRQAGLGGSLEELRQIWREHDLRIRDVDPQEASDLLANGLHWYDVYLDPPVYDDVPPLVDLLRARLRTLPPPRPIERREVTDAERRRIARAFARSKDAVRAVDNELIASWFIDFAADHGAGDPLRWRPIAVETLLLDFFPRKVIIDAETVGAVPDVLRGFVRYAAARKKLSAGSIAETLETVDQFEREFLAAMRDDARAGQGKVIGQAMLADGIDFGDPAAVQRWIHDFNARPFQERDRILASALGMGPVAGDEVAKRRAFAFPPQHVNVDGTRAHDLDPSDADDRELLIRAEHPEFARALRRGEDVQVGGQTLDPRLHVLMHLVVANQLWDGDPPEAWEAARRLTERGYERHEVLHRLANVVSEDIGERLDLGGRKKSKSVDAEAMTRNLRAAYLTLAESEDVDVGPQPWLRVLPGGRPGSSDRRK